VEFYSEGYQLLKELQSDMSLPSHPLQPKHGRVVVLGLGGGGGAIVHHMTETDAGQQVMIAAADTDREALERLEGVLQVPLGQGWNCENGCGGDATLGERAAASSVDDLRALITGAKMLFVVAGLGGGTAGGSARVVGRIAREEEVPVFFLLTFPFAFEGRWLRKQAEEAIPPLRDAADALMVVQSDLLFTTVSADTPAVKAFDFLVELMARTVAGITAIAWADWLLKADFATIARILRDHPETCSVGIGSGSGSNRWIDAVNAFVDCPLVGGADVLRTADAAVLTVSVAEDLSVGELRECLMQLQQYFSEHARVVVGACSNETHEGEVQITGVICRASEPKPLQQAGESIRAETVGLSESDSTQSARKARIPKKKSPGASGGVQAELPFQEQRLGFFSGVSPTVHNGENLDVPTFQRRGILIDRGD
jgi:cell division protein FtsZ